MINRCQKTFDLSTNCRGRY